MDGYLLLSTFLACTVYVAVYSFYFFYYRHLFFYYVWSFVLFKKIKIIIYFIIIYFITKYNLNTTYNITYLNKYFK
jgi:hypothetical protein